MKDKIKKLEEINKRINQTIGKLETQLFIEGVVKFK